MTDDDSDTGRTLRRDLARGGLAGLALGVVLAVLVAVAGFPEWARTLWSFVFIAAVALLPLSLALRVVAHGVWRLTQIGIPRDRHERPSAYVLAILSPGNVAGGAAIVAYLVLLATFVVGDDGRTSPF